MIIALRREIYECRGEQSPIFTSTFFTPVNLQLSDYVPLKICSISIIQNYFYSAALNAVSLRTSYRSFSIALLQKKYLLKYDTT